MFNMNYIPAFWYSSNNFGDALTPYLIRKISNKMPVLINKEDEKEKFMVTGSILNNPVENSVVWGCGVAFSDDTIYPHKKICAVRGKLTGELCKEQDIIFDEVYGDPAILLPRYYTPQINPGQPKFKLGVIPHYADTAILLDKLKCSPEKLAHEYGIKIIDIMNDVETVIDEIVSCDKIISSTLHGIIASHAYNIPCIWAKFSDLVGGDDFKFMDYYSTTDAEITKFIDLRGEIDIHSLEEIARFMPKERVLFTVDIDMLLNACPFK